MILLDIHSVLLDFAKAVGVSRHVYDSNLDLSSVGLDFWLNIPKYSWYDELIDLVESYDSVCLCTKPTPISAGHIQEWININLPEMPYIITAEKKLCKGNLIDDVAEYEPAILFPQYYNANSHWVHKEVQFVKQELDRIYG